MLAAPPLELELFDDLRAVEQPWRALGQCSGNLFGTWDWASLWWDEHGGGRRPVVGLCRDERGSAVAVLPLFLETVGVFRVLRLVGRYSSDELGPVCAPEDRSAAAEALARLLAQAPFEWDVFVGEDMPGEFPWDRVLRGRTLRRGASPVMRLGGRSWDELCQARSRGFREKVRRGERRLHREHRVTWRTTSHLGQLDADLDHLFRLHQARWGSRTSTFAGPDRSLKRRFAAVALERGWLRLRLLELDGRPAAACLNYRFGDAELHYQAGRDPAFDRYGLGFALHTYAIRSAVAEGADRYLLLRGGEAYKLRFADEDPGVVTVGVVKQGAPAEALAAATPAA